jgi:hypothetical protein
MVRRIQKYTVQTDLYMVIDEEVVHLTAAEEEVVHLTAPEEVEVHLIIAEEEEVHLTAAGRTKLLCMKTMENSVLIPQPVTQHT